MLRPSREDPNLTDREAQQLGREGRDRILLTLADFITGFPLFTVGNLHHVRVLSHFANVPQCLRDACGRAGKPELEKEMLPAVVVACLEWLNR